MSKATEDSLNSLHGALAEVLMEAIKAKDEDGKVNASVLSVARQFLKDNGVEALPDKNPGLKSLAESLPFPSPDDDDQAFVTH